MFQTQDEPGPRFFDAVVGEYACTDDRTRLRIVVSIQVGMTAFDDKVVIRRVDSLLSQVLSTCIAQPVAVGNAARAVGLGEPC
jgi:hypothetical protein